MTLSRSDALALSLQRHVARANFLWFGPAFVAAMRAGFGYRMPDLRRFRAEVRSLVWGAGERAPIIVCANHLTLIDSMLIMWALFSARDYLADFRLLPWNMPELRNFARNAPLRVMCYLGKCVYVERGADAAKRRRTLDKFTHLLERRELLLIFPEGGRSRSGAFDEAAVTYSVGELVLARPGTKILCVYMRGRAQATWSNFPARGDTFDPLVTLLDPPPVEPGRRGARTIAQAIGARLAGMEAQYFAELGPLAATPQSAKEQGATPHAPLQDAPV